MEELSISHFRELLDKHIKDFKDLCTVWKNVLSSQTVPEEVNDEIRTTIGLTNLLMQQKMKQFGELIDDSEYNRGEKEITCLDLQGFWDMVYNEIEKIQKSFKKLEKCQNNNWVFIEEQISKVEPKKKPGLAINTKVTAAAKERAIAARQRLAEAKLKMKAQLANNGSNNKMDVTGTINKASTKLTDQISTPEEKGIGNIEDLNSNSPRKQAQRKQSLKIIENIQSSDKEKVSPSDDLKTVKMPAKKRNKENFSVPERNTPKSGTNTPNEKSSANEPALHKKRSTKETMPLQCLTRSAKKALLAMENASKND